MSAAMRKSGFSRYDGLVVLRDIVAYAKRGAPAQPTTALSGTASEGAKGFHVVCEAAHEVVEV